MNKTTKVRVKKSKTAATGIFSGVALSEAAMLRMADYMARTEKMHAAWIQEYKDAIFTGVLAGSKNRKLKIDPARKLRKVKGSSSAQPRVQKESA
ncbi:hypothetical protein ALP94_03913 [Pseudomonas savastanoi pv. glycinea]|uniref:hypothetical protein n=1 Tax=Pseudomonas quasicaspiana TaxID=2829821 RepID=UPI000EFEE776|nr:hypothetical protein [Pseudomonas quasicaspiana]MCD5976780.1 hypothetical protein [Pseudomonas quasicaspiana]RMQ98670.1 hypothetical protein ALP94_03913 [Pseudomonas savastanoi pv. glycinea]